MLADIQQCPRGTTPQRLDAELGQTGERLAQLPRREYDRNPLRQETAGRKGQRTRRRGIEPMRFINDTQERLLVGGLRQQAEQRQPDQERIGDWPGAEPERDRKRPLLRIREAVHQLHPDQRPPRGHCARTSRTSWSVCVAGTTRAEGERSAPVP
jgi:hypothetical protein